MPETPSDQLLLYSYVEDVLERRGPHREAHLAHLQAERDAGRLLIAGAYGDPVRGAAIGFHEVTRDQVERFVAEDPYQRAGLIVSHEIHPWKLV